MKQFFRLLIFPVILLAAYHCQRIESLPAVPYIEYRSFEIFDTVDPLGNKYKGGRLEFYFEDGDGDIGLNPYSAEAPDADNLIVTAYRKKNGNMVQVVRDTINPDPYYISSFRIPYMEKEGQNKIIKGTIDVDFLYLRYTLTDTIMYDFYITDRALNESNIVSTNEIIVGKNDTY